MILGRMSIRAAIAVPIGLFALFLSFPVQNAEAAVKTWDGGGDGTSWSDPANWSGDGVPSGGDTIVIDGNGGVDSSVILDVSFQVDSFGSISISSGDSLTISSGVTLDNRGSIVNLGTINNLGTLRSEGTLDADATIANNPGGTINNSGTIFNNQFTLFDNGDTISNSGTIFNRDTIQSLGTINNSGIIVNFDSIDSIGTIANDGTIINLGGSSLTSSGTIDNNLGGTINNFGNINNHDGGLISNHPGATINNDANGSLLNGLDSTITNDGIIVNNNLGTLNNAGTINNSGTISNNFLLANIINSGTINNLATINNAGTIDNFGIIDNYGTLTNTGTIHNFGTINNKCGSIFINAGTFSGNPVNNESCEGVYDLNLFENGDPSDLVYNLGQEARAVAETTDPVVTQVTFRWNNPSGDTIETEIVPLTLGSAESAFTPDEVGMWEVEADFGNGVVVRQTVNVPFSVVPESAIGVVALVGSSLAALGVFVLRKKHGNSHNRGLDDLGI